MPTLVCFPLDRTLRTLAPLAIGMQLACSPGAGSEPSERMQEIDAGSAPSAMTDAAAPELHMPEPEQFEPEDFFEEDPVVLYCGPDGEAMPHPDPPGGTPECPDDKNLEGCPCDINLVGSTASCWPGLRVNRNRGICQDGVTTCMAQDEFRGQWGPCEGAVLPQEDATRGAPACQCFSAGQWQIDNVSLCHVIDQDDNPLWAMRGDCPSAVEATPPASVPSSGNRLTVDCAGQFQLCHTVKAGDVDDPQPTDCVLGTACVEVWYEESGVAQELPQLPAWTTANTTCIERYLSVGAYGEMTVQGLSVECEDIDDGMGAPYVFGRAGYSPDGTPDTSGSF